MEADTGREHNDLVPRFALLGRANEEGVHDGLVALMQKMSEQWKHVVAVREHSLRLVADENPSEPA